MNILLCNDDGITSQGILELRRELVDRGHHVVTVAPDSERSASGHALTVHLPIRVKAVDLGDTFPAYSTSGSPADCVCIGLSEFLPNADMVVSGINPGVNTGQDTQYSGTVAAAMEGAMRGFPALAVSVAGVMNRKFTVAARYGADMAEHLEKHPLPKGIMCNLNIPALAEEEIRGVRLTTLNSGTMISGFQRVEFEKTHGMEQWFFPAKYALSALDQGSDREVLDRGYVSVSYLRWQMDATPAECPFPESPGWRRDR